MLCSCKKDDIQIKGNENSPKIANSDIDIYAMLDIDAESDYSMMSQGDDLKNEYKDEPCGPPIDSYFQN